MPSKGKSASEVQVHHGEMLVEDTGVLHDIAVLGMMVQEEVRVGEQKKAFWLLDTAKQAAQETSKRMLTRAEKVSDAPTSQCEPECVVGL